MGRRNAGKNRPAAQLLTAAGAALLVAAAGAALHAVDAPRPANTERAMLGGSPERNLVVAEKGLPTTWDVATGRNVKWTAELGGASYAGPVVAGGRVFVGTNNEHPRNPKVQGDQGILLALSAADGHLLWQAAHPKLAAGRAQDWPQVGLCSTPAVEGDALYYLSNRAEVVALAAGTGARLWTLDLLKLGVVPHYMTSSSPVVAGNLLFAVTGNGPADGKVPASAAPSFIAVDRRTGKLRWSDSSPGARLLDGQWGSPAYGTLAGRPQVVFPGGDGWLYAFAPETGKLLWKFDANQPPASAGGGGGGGQRTHESLVATPVLHDGRLYVGLGHDPQNPASHGRLWALESRADGTVHPVWSLGGDDFQTTLSNVVVADGIVYAADFAGFLHAIDAATGKQLWKQDTLAAVWSSPLVADGKVYLGDEDGDLLVFKAGREAKLLGKANLGQAIYTTPTAKDGVLYIATRSRLFALQEGRKGAPGGPAKPGGQASNP
jgi:outer membrane protein assembly factor BamB